VLCFDVGFEYITFTHFVEDQLKDKLQFSLYDERPITGTTIDYQGNEIYTDCYVLSDASRYLRCEDRLITAMEKQHQLKHSRIGNTKLLVVNCEDVLNTAKNMLTNGDYFFSEPENKIAS